MQKRRNVARQQLRVEVRQKMVPRPANTNRWHENRFPAIWANEPFFASARCAWISRRWHNVVNKSLPMPSQQPQHTGDALHKIFLWGLYHWMHSKIFAIVIGQKLIASKEKDEVMKNLDVSRSKKKLNFLLGNNTEKVTGQVFCALIGSENMTKEDAKMGNKKSEIRINQSGNNFLVLFLLNQTTQFWVLNCLEWEFFLPNKDFHWTCCQPF